MHTYALAGGELRSNARIPQDHAVISRFGVFRCMGETGAIPSLGLLRIARLQRHGLAADGHNQYIAKVAVPRTREMRVREPQDRRVFIAITGRPFIALLERSN